MPISQLESKGNRIVLHFDSLDDAMRLLSPWRGNRPRVQAAESINTALNAVGLAMEVRVKGRLIAELGSDHMTGPLMALLQASAG